MSEQGTKAAVGYMDRSHGWAGRDNPKSNGTGLRSRAVAAAARVRDLSRARADGVKLWGVNLGGNLPEHRELEGNERYLELVRGARLVDSAIDRGVVVPLSVVSNRLTVESSGDSALRLGYVRSLDIISHSSKGVERGMPPLLALLVSVAMLLINPNDYLGEIKGILAVLVPLCLYWLSQRSKRKALEAKQQHQTTEDVFKFSTDKEKRLEERESKLRQEERDFMHSQIRLSRQRGHILARGYMALEMANDRLIEMMRDHEIEVPPILYTQKTRAQVLGELKAVEDELSATEGGESDAAAPKEGN